MTQVRSRHMSRNGRARSDATKGEATRRQIKLAARRLFATRGLQAVSIRDILRAAGQKNSGSINYYFTSKTALVRELIVDTAKLLDDEQGRLLAELEANGGPRSIHEIVSILTHYPSIDAPGDVRDRHALRFLNMMMINHRDLIFEALRDGADNATRRCLSHLRLFMPELPAPVVQQRLILIVMYLFAAAASREAGREKPALWRSLWGHPAASENLIDTVAGMLTQPPSPRTLVLADKRSRSAQPSTAIAKNRRKHERSQTERSAHGVGQ